MLAYRDLTKEQLEEVVIKAEGSLQGDMCKKY